MKIKVDIDPQKIIKRRGLDKNGRAQMELATATARLCDPYVPMSGGHLKNSVQIRPGKLIYPGPYAHYQWHGEIMGPNYPDGQGGWWSPAPKYYTGRPIQYSGAPMRGKKWNERMKEEKGKVLVRLMAQYMGGKPK